LSRASQQSLDVVHVFGGGRFTALRKVNLPALPSVFAAARVSVPGAVTGALLAEWLSTGTGIGGSILKFNAQAQFAQLWTSIALITLITLVLYNLVQIVENIVLARMGMAAGRSAPADLPAETELQGRLADTPSATGGCRVSHGIPCTSAGRGEREGVSAGGRGGMTAAGSSCTFAEASSASGLVETPSAFTRRPPT
jgi:hypothetical protein